MIADCLAAGLAEPQFEQHGPHFVATLWRSRPQEKGGGSEDSHSILFWRTYAFLQLVCLNISCS